MDRHPYRRSPHSGAGNCHCGWWERSPIHGYPWPQPASPQPGLSRVRAAIRKARGNRDAPVHIRGYA